MPGRSPWHGHSKSRFRHADAPPRRRRQAQSVSGSAGGLKPHGPGGIGSARGWVPPDGGVHALRAPCRVYLYDVEMPSDHQSATTILVLAQPIGQSCYCFLVWPATVASAMSGAMRMVRPGTGQGHGIPPCKTLSSLPWWCGPPNLAQT
jgi:hypothetical protein